MKLTSIQHLKGLLCANKIARQSASSKAATFDVELSVYFHLEKRCRQVENNIICNYMRRLMRIQKHVDVATEASELQ